MRLIRLVSSIAAAVCFLAPVRAAAQSVPTRPAPEKHALPIESDYEKLGDFDAMRKRRLVRVLVVNNKTNYFIDRGTPRGLTADAFQMFDDFINRKYKTGNLRIHVALIPVRRDKLWAELLRGRGDVAAASLTVTPERREMVDFAAPVFKNVSEIVVDGPAGEPLASADDLSGREVFVRKDSLYHEDLDKLNADLKARGKPTVSLRFAPETLEDEDLLEMVNAGLVPYVVVDDKLARFWAGVFPGLRLNPQAVLRTGADIAWAIRKNSPLLEAELNAFIAKYPEGSAIRNMILQKYLKNMRLVKNARSPESMERFERVVQVFRTYSDKYDMDFLLMAAQGYQESQLNQDARSPVGAIGVMQLMPATGKSLNVGDIRELEPNIHAGVKYMRFMIDQYFAKDSMDRLNRGLFAFAAYNAGPARIQSLRREAAKRGLDPNVWFHNVEVVASEKIGRETVAYVANIYKYYVAYTLVLEQYEARRKAREIAKELP